MTQIREANGQITTSVTTIRSVDSYKEGCCEGTRAAVSQLICCSNRAPVDALSRLHKTDWLLLVAHIVDANLSP
jgi:hypothetical protein